MQTSPRVSAPAAARYRRLRKLTRVTFPARDAPVAPEWLGWSDENWVRNREIWYDHLDAVLNVDVYLVKHFHADERVREAEAELVRVILMTTQMS